MNRVLFLLAVTFALGFLVLPSGDRVQAVPAAAGDLDLDFGGFGEGGVRPVNGMVLTDAALQSDGRIVVAGYNGTAAVLKRFRHDGSLDTTFGQAGAVTLNLEVVSTHGLDLAVQANDKIVIAGTTAAFDTADMFVARLQANGAADTAFGVNGWQVTDFAGKEDRAQGLAIQPDGKILVAGAALMPKTADVDDFDFAVARYDTAGLLDPTFDGDGRVVVAFDNGPALPPGWDDDLGTGIYVQPGGKIVVVGSVFDGVILSSSDDDFGVVRLNADGSLDDSFNGDGKVSVGLGGNDVPYAVTAYADGRLLVLGTKQSLSGEARGAGARFLGNGELDTTIDGDGKFSVGGVNRLVDAAVAADGTSFMLGVDDNNGGPNQLKMVRMTENGFLDPTFNGTGVITLADEVNALANSLYAQPDGKMLVTAGDKLLRILPGGGLDAGGAALTSISFEDDVVYDAVVQPDGKLVVAGVGAAQPGARDVALARYNPDGSPDAGFRYGGKAYFATNLDEYGRAIALQPDGKIVIAGNTEFSGQDFAVYRLNADGTRDGTFNVVGYRIIVFGEGDDVARAVAILPDGKILVGGYTADDSFALARLQPDGRNDPTFGTGGKAKMLIGSGRVEARAMLVLPDGRIVVGGFHNSGGPARGEFVLASFLPDGAPDLDFGSDGTGIVEMGFSDSFGNAYYDTIQALALLPNGLIVASGYSGGDWATVLFKDDGTLANYPFVWPLRTSWEMAASARDIVVQEDGKFIVVGGGVNAGASSSRFLMARYRLGGAGPRLDTEFGDAGRVETAIQDRAGAHAVTIDAASIYVAGYSDNGHDLDFAVTKYAADVQPLSLGKGAIYLPAVLREEDP